MEANLCLEKTPGNILRHFDEIMALADSERSSLGFLREQALRDSIERGKMLALLDRSGKKTKLAAYLLYSGVYPHAKIQQIATAEAYRRQGVASALLRALIAELEQLEFMTIRADVASDLRVALAFYASHAFERVKVRAGAGLPAIDRSSCMPGHLLPKRYLRGQTISSTQLTLVFVGVVPESIHFLPLI